MLEKRAVEKNIVEKFSSFRKFGVAGTSQTAARTPNYQI